MTPIERDRPVLVHYPLVDREGKGIVLVSMAGCNHNQSGFAAFPNGYYDRG
jgi:hypothetical protein